MRLFHPFSHPVYTERWINYLIRYSQRSSVILCGLCSYKGLPCDGHHNRE